MAVFLLKLVFFLLSAVSSLLSRLVFTAAAYLVVQIVQVVKVPGDGGQRVLDQVKNLITTCMEFLMDLIVKAITSVLSSVFDFVKDGLFSSSSGLAAGMAGLLEKSKVSLEDAMKDIPEVLDAFKEMVGKIFADVLNNCSDAVAYVAENVLK